MNNASETFLIVSEDQALIAAVQSALADTTNVRLTASVAEARALMQQGAPLGIIVDGATLRGQPVQQLAALRAGSPLVNILFVTNELRGVLVNDIQPLRVELLARPLPAAAIKRFVDRTLAAGRLSDREVATWIGHLATEHKLSGNDIALFPLVLDRETPEALCARLNIDREALSRGLRRLVKKCRVRNTDRLAKNLMRDALLLTTRQPGSALHHAYAAA
jgi:hypothetical protein